MKCPKCESKNINQYRMMTGKIWCEDCGFSVPNKEKFNPFVEKTNENNSFRKLIDKCNEKNK